MLQGGVTTFTNFTRTRWSIVRGSVSDDSLVRQQALEELCQSYWPPLFHYACYTGSSPSDAEDQVQGFFATLLKHRDFEPLDPQQGRFRAYLIACFKHYRSSLYRRENAQKRGGEFRFCSLAELPPDLLPDRQESSPDSAYDHAWAMLLVKQVHRQLRTQADSPNDPDILEKYLPGGTAPPLQESAQELGISLGALKTRIRRFRQAYGHALITAVSDTLTNPADLQDELQLLIKALSR